MVKDKAEFIRSGAAGRQLFTAPFGLAQYLTKPAIKVDLIPVVDLFVIALLFSLLFTRFVIFPGVRIELPETGLRMQESLGGVAVLTIGNKGMLLFDGKVFEEKSIADGFEKYIQRSDYSETVLLVKAQARMELQAFLDLCQMAQEAGFKEVQIAGQYSPVAESRSEGGLPGTSPFLAFPEGQ